MRSSLKLKILKFMLRVTAKAFTDSYLDQFDLYKFNGKYGTVYLNFTRQVNNKDDAISL